MSKITPTSLNANFSGPAGTRIDTRSLELARGLARLSPEGIEDPEAHLAALRSALVEGEASGPATPFDFEAFIASKRAAGTRVD
jgi:antitoxin ParD1/3/4